MRNVWQQFTRFVRGIFRRPAFKPGTVADGPEVEMETERKRGMRGL